MQTARIDPQLVSNVKPDQAGEEAHQCSIYEVLRNVNADPTTDDTEHRKNGSLSFLTATDNTLRVLRWVKSRKLERCGQREHARGLPMRGLVPRRLAMWRKAA